MKRKLLVIVCFLILMLTNGCDKSVNTGTLELDKVKPQRLTLEIVKELSKKGNQLSRKDFNNYEGTEIGSGLYIMEYPVDNKYAVLIGSEQFNGTPVYILLVRKNDKQYEKGIDIRYEDVDKYIGSGT
jgi:hypothetical protein